MSDGTTTPNLLDPTSVSPANDQSAQTTPPAPSIPFVATAEGLPRPVVEAAPAEKSDVNLVETIGTPVVEVLKPAETFPVPTPIKVEKPAEKAPQVVTTITPTIPVTHVVDKRTNKEVITAHLKSAQPLTLEADEEEKDFIEHVEEIHKSD